MKYKTPRALEQAVKAAAKRSGRDANKAIKGFYHDRFLCRVFSLEEPAFVLKGGQSMLAKIQNAREAKLPERLEDVIAAETHVASWLNPVLAKEAIGLQWDPISGVWR